MKNLIFILLALFSWNSISVNAQVTIGGGQEPHKGAILDLSPDGGYLGGLLLPQVSLNSATTWDPLGDVETDSKNGMVVYNTNTSLSNGLKGKGMYIWNDQSWNLILVGIPVESIAISSSTGSYRVETNKSLTLTVTVMPDNANSKAVRWYVAAGGSAVTLSGQTSSGVTVTAGATVGNATVVAIAQDKSSVAAAFYITITDPYICAPDNNEKTFIVGNSGYYYRTMSYPTGNADAAECWMVENSHENSYAARYYSGNSSMDNGAYYSWYQATVGGTYSPCPEGWGIPTATQWGNIRAAVSGGSNTEWWDNNSSGKAFAGRYNFNISAFDGWTTNGYWWSSSLEKQNISSTTAGLSPVDGGGTTNSNTYYSVRCVKQ